MKLSFDPKEKNEVLAVLMLRCYWVVKEVMTSHSLQSAPRINSWTVLLATHVQALSINCSKCSIRRSDGLLILAFFVPLLMARESPGVSMSLLSCLHPGRDRLGETERDCFDYSLAAVSPL
jgi:hypothetical protein